MNSDIEQGPPMASAFVRNFVSYLNRDGWNWLFVGLVVVGFVLGALDLYFNPQWIGEYWQRIDPVVGLVTMVAVFLGWIAGVFKGIEMETEIDIVLKTNDQSRLTLPYRPLRSQLNRAELQGIIGFYYGMPRYDTSFLVPVLGAPERRRIAAQSGSEGRPQCSGGSGPEKLLRNGSQKRQQSAAGWHFVDSAT
jgi:hypothetical protein